MADPLGRVLRDEEIEQAILNTLGDSEIEDEGDYDGDFSGNFGGQARNITSDSDSEDELLLSRPGPRTRGGTRRFGRVRTRGGRGISQGRGYVNVQPVNRVRPEWAETSFIPTKIQFTQPAYTEFDPESFADIFDYFRHYIDHEIIELIVYKSNQTHLNKFGTNLSLNESELYVYIGITIVMAGINYPKIRMYWETKYRVPLIADHMSRNRFLQLRNSLKFVYDDDVTREERSIDKVWKIRPLLDKILKGCQMQTKQECLSIDDMIIPFTGQCGIKQYIPGKPNPTGLKVFVLANPNGMVCNFKIYQGETTYPNYNDTNFGLAAKAILDITENLVPGHKLYFERYFTSVKLTEELLKRNMLCTGTIMKNRIPRVARDILKEDRVMRNEGRGVSQILVNGKGDLALTKWYDNKGVTLLSTTHAIEPMDTCKRWCKVQRTYIQVPRPDVIKAYNDKMGGVDLADRLLAVCPNRYRTRKWTQRVFSHMIDLALSNSWLLYKTHKIAQRVPARQISQLGDFKLELGENLIEAYTVTDISGSSESDEEDLRFRRRGRPVTIKVPSQRIRRKGAGHMPDMTAVQNRCRFCHKNKTNVRCIKCNIHLCFTRQRNCFKNFHS